MSRKVVAEALERNVRNVLQLVEAQR